MPITLPTAKEWSPADIAKENTLLDNLTTLLSEPKTNVLVIGALAELCNPLLTPDPTRGKHWIHYRNGTRTLNHFFREWLKYAPTTASPGKYIEQWDYLANTQAGLKLTSEDQVFKTWFISDVSRM